MQDGQLTSFDNQTGSLRFAIENGLKINRFDEELFSITPENVQEKMLAWENEFGTFPDVFETQIMQRGTLSDKEYATNLIAFTQHVDMREAYDSTVLLYQNFSVIQNDLELAFGQFSVNFPSFPIPEITLFFGGFNYGVVTYDGNIAIGLEHFLGEKSKFYRFVTDNRKSFHETFCIGKRYF